MRLVDALSKAKSKATCYKTPLGVVIANKFNLYTLGWNGGPTPRDNLECKVEKDENDKWLCYRYNAKSGEGVEDCPSVHAERRAISFAAKIAGYLENGKIYMSGWFPCVDCMKSIIEAGIKEVYTPSQVYDDRKNHVLAEYLQNQSYNFEMSEKLARESGLKIIENCDYEKMNLEEAKTYSGDMSV